MSPALSAALVPLPFTAREHEVATLLSGGLSNREIATAMAVSVRTVEGHIYQASAKAGVSSRIELSTLVRRFQHTRSRAGQAVIASSGGEVTVTTVPLPTPESMSIAPPIASKRTRSEPSPM